MLCWNSRFLFRDIVGLYLVSGRCSSASHGGGSDLSPGQVTWDFQWTKCILRQVVSKYFRFPCQFWFRKLLHIHLSSYHRRCTRCSWNVPRNFGHKFHIYKIIHINAVYFGDSLKLHRNIFSPSSVSFGAYYHWFPSWFIFYPEDGGDILLRNVGISPNSMPLLDRKPYSS
jgi:hypothetical protein